MPEHGSTESELLTAADKAMYAAKQGGRNQIIVYQKAQLLSSPVFAVDKLFRS
jgi:predicted signal transduction protein with EAL and GGDEF domain